MPQRPKHPHFYGKAFALRFMGWTLDGLVLADINTNSN